MQKPRTTTIELHKEEMKFSAGHFTIFSATERENLHGHNFTVYVALEGIAGDNGILIDHSTYKRIVIDRCSAWNETFLLPGSSPYLRIERQESGEIFAFFGNERLVFLARDVTILPVRNVTLEELARLFGEGLTADGAQLTRQGVSRLTVKCTSAPGQSSSWEWHASA